MRRHLRKPWFWILVALLFAAWLLWPRPVASPGPESPAGVGQEANPSAPSPDVAARPHGHAALQRDLPGFLPPEAAPVVARILDGDAHPNPQDGGIFFNRERRLPERPRGHYREYTVETPGLDHRGARRIVTGGDPPREWYYTGDHYDSFRRFEVRP